MRRGYGSLNERTGRRCACGRPISARAVGCRLCRVYPARPLAERFWAKVPTLGVGCWEWAGGRDNDEGYGRIREGRGGSPFLLTHRVAWELTQGPIPDGLMVLHKCDNPPCVRPDHLFLGTNTDNMRDASAKGRMQHGEAWYASRPWAKRRAS